MKMFCSAGKTSVTPSPASSRKAGAIRNAAPVDRYRFSTVAKTRKKSSHGVIVAKIEVGPWAPGSSYHTFHSTVRACARFRS